MGTAFVFPGQGSQSVGMGKALAERYGAAREVFARVDAALAQNLSRLMFEGPESELTLTANAQPALMAASLAAARVLETEAGLDFGRDAQFVAGHSLGEYSALAAAAAFTIEDAARLLRIRGQAMQAAVPVGEGAMAAILGLDFSQSSAIAAQAARELHLQGAICEAANDNGAGQVVISGTKAAVDRAMELAKLKGAKRAMLLPVSAPFHCALMQPAAEAMAAALAKVEIKRPKAPLIANVTARATQDPAEIRKNLVAQIVGAVRWRESVLHMAEHGVSRFVELGAGKVLSGLVKRIAEGATAISIGAPDDVEVFIARATHS
jgi:[acyl-carrier-protein] S-malonyltransferase